MNQKIFNGITILTLLVVVILMVMIVIRSKNITFLDTAEFKDVPQSLKDDYLNKTIPAIQQILKKEVVDKGYLDENTIISNGLVYGPCLLANTLGANSKSVIPPDLCKNFCSGDSDCNQKEGTFCNNYQCEKISDNSCENDTDCVFEQNGNLQICGDDKKCTNTDICKQTGGLNNGFSVPPIYDANMLACNSTTSPIHVLNHPCNNFGNVPYIGGSCAPGKKCYFPKGNPQGMCLNTKAPQ